MVIECAEIEIIAPVLTRDGGKWRGKFEKRNISFEIRDEQFLTQVTVKQLKFQNGTSMSCRLFVHLREDEMGVPQPHEYVVAEVHKLRSKNRRRMRTNHKVVPASEGDDPSDNPQGSLLPRDS